ncbi:MAG: ATP-binding protein [Anaerolineaceae bacterium]|nr:ATP-binding protein [Anaerolineaceae bacterium]
MKQILVISGKGGTGKTTLTGALSELASREKRLVLADADVDAANLELLLEPEKQETFSFRAGKTAVINQDLCIQCGRCEEVCRFEAVETQEDGSYTINESMCEGCLSCVHQCPVDAIDVVERDSGEWYRSKTPYGTLFHALLYPGEENSGKLVTQIKTDAQRYANQHSADLLLIDGPPGIGCPVTAACQGVDIAIIVSEPTVSGRHDLERVKQVTDFFHIRSFLVLNKSDLNQAIRDEIVDFSKTANIPLIGEIPYEENIIYAQAQGKPVTKNLDSTTAHYFYRIWNKLKKEL